MTKSKEKDKYIKKSQEQKIYKTFKQKKTKTRKKFIL